MKVEKVPIRREEASLYATTFISGSNTEALITYDEYGHVDKRSYSRIGLIHFGYEEPNNSSNSRSSQRSSSSGKSSSLGKTVASGVGSAAVAGAKWLWSDSKSKITPEEREARRREAEQDCIEAARRRQELFDFCKELFQNNRSSKIEEAKQRADLEREDPYGYAIYMYEKKKSRNKKILIFGVIGAFFLSRTIYIPMFFSLVILFVIYIILSILNRKPKKSN